MNRHRLLCSAALSLALASLAAPVAGAQTQQDLRSPDTRDAAQTAEAPQDLRSPDTVDAAEGRGTHTSPEVLIVKSQPQTQPQPATADGIDWADAGIGAGTLLGLSLVALGSGLFVVHRKRAARDARPVAGV